MDATAAAPPTTPPRTWVVETYFKDENQQWVHDESALTNAMLECIGIVNRIGGQLQVATQRAEIAEGRVETVGAVFRWVPPTMAPPPQPPAEPQAPAPETPGSP